MLVVKLTPLDKGLKPTYLLIEEAQFSSFCSSVRRDQYKIAARKVEDFFHRAEETIARKKKKKREEEE